MPHDKLYDIGEDRRDAAEPVSAPGAKKDYPTITINDTKLPFLKDKDIGNEFSVEAFLRVVSVSEPDDWDTTQKGKYFRLEIRKMGEPAKQS